MYLPLALFFKYLSSFEWWFGPVLQIGGFLCLWMGRYTARYYTVFGKKYYLFSAIVRPVGIFLIAWGWVEIFATIHPPSFLIVKSDYRLIQWIIIIFSLLIIIYDSVLRRTFLLLGVPLAVLTALTLFLTGGDIFGFMGS